MDNRDSVVVVGEGCRVGLTIFAAPQRDSRWDEQLDLIRRTGAQYEDRSWHLWLDGPTLTEAHLADLWRAVVEYGTTVRINSVEAPGPGPPANPPANARQGAARKRRLPWSEG
jgi:uncharacterized protein RhaS with RHS repeats